ncbi:AraC family transcriptional regulator [Pseudarthrobacter sp. SSS035]|uniref:AraC family transcriptional regulator n=1 Tax=Pseudarthrobacter sp. SSS035 TaxID=2931399 RepID=UPI00200D94F2|nr:AraC family transcriptional regulator [Pseudarthrobacter sp. SSS035]
MTFSRLRVHPASAARTAGYAPAATLGPRRLQSYELVWLLTGSARWTVDEPDVSAGITRRHDNIVAPGTLALARPGTIESYRWDEHTPTTHAFIHLDIEPSADAPPPTEWPLMRRFSADDPLAGMCSYLLTLARMNSEESRSRSDEIVELLVDIYLRGPLESAGPRIAGPRIQQALDFVGMTWQTEGVRIISLQELATAAGVSVGHLSREFRDEFRVGPITALERVRLGQAAIALQRSTYRIEEIAHQAGYSNPYHFSRRFSGTYGIPPRRYRRDSRGKDPLQPLTDSGLLPVWTAATSTRIT